MQSPTRIGLSDGFVPSNPRLKGVNAGSPLRQSTVNNITRATIRNSVKSSPFYKVKQKEEGYTLELKKEQVLSYGQSPLTALYTKIPSSNPNSTAMGIVVTTGVVNNEVPKISGKYLDEVDSTGFPPYIQVAGTGYVCVKVSGGSAGNPFPSKNVEIVFITGSLEDKNTDTEGYFPIARLFYDPAGNKTSFSVLSRGNLICNRIKVGENTAFWQFTPYGY